MVWGEEEEKGGSVLTRFPTLNTFRAHRRLGLIMEELLNISTEIYQTLLGNKHRLIDQELAVVEIAILLHKFKQEHTMQNLLTVLFLLGKETANKIFVDYNIVSIRDRKLVDFLNVVISYDGKVPIINPSKLPILIWNTVQVFANFFVINE